jgi:hypothetical protein
MLLSFWDFLKMQMKQRLNTAIETAFDNLPELKEFAEKNKKEEAFSEEFPEEHKRMQELAAAEASVVLVRLLLKRYERVLILLRVKAIRLLLVRPTMALVLLFLVVC